MIFTQCPQFSTPCRFCSQEHQYITYNQLTENPKTKRLEANLNTMIRKEALGAWCNNSSQWCRDITQCPARLALAYEPWCGQKADGTGSYAKLIGSMEMKALMSERVIGQTTLEGVV